MDKYQVIATHIETVLIGEPKNTYEEAKKLADYMTKYKYYLDLTIYDVIKVKWSCNQFVQ